MSIHTTGKTTIPHSVLFDHRVATARGKKAWHTVGSMGENVISVTLTMVSSLMPDRRLLAIEYLFSKSSSEGANTLKGQRGIARLWLR